jgi:hypothetical protein
MPRTQTVPPPVSRDKRGKAINLYLKLSEVAEFDAYATQMGGTRSDAFRWLLALAREAVENSRKKTSPLS